MRCIPLLLVLAACGTPASVKLSHENERVAGEAGIADADVFVGALILDLDAAFALQREWASRMKAATELERGRTAQEVLDLVMADEGKARAEDLVTLQRVRRRWEEILAGNWADWRHAHETTGQYVNRSGPTLREGAEYAKSVEELTAALRERKIREESKEETR